MRIKPLAMMAKDLRLVFSDGAGIVQPVLLGLILVFVFSLSTPVGEEVPAQAAAAIFWLATSFAVILVFNTLYSLEGANQARIGLLLAPIPVQYIWIGKAISGLVLLLAAQLFFLPAIVVFLGQDEIHSWPLALGSIMLVNWGLVAVGSLLGAMSQGHSARDSLLSVVVFPLLIPVLLAGISMSAYFFGDGSGEDLGSWVGLVLAFNALFTGAALLLFPFIYGEY